MFLGGMVVAVLSLLLLMLAATFGFFGYRLWRTAQVERAAPSIQELGEKPISVQASPETPSEPVTQPTPSPSAPTPSAPTPDLATLEVKVLNGGAPKGSAGTLVDLLKKAGYAKANFGNSTTDHQGTVLYYAAASQAAAETLKPLIAKTYPAVTLTPAPANDKDATAAAIVIVLGKQN